MDMRSQNATRNAILSIIYEILILILGLMVPKIVISIYGSEVYGLSSTINQMLQILNLMQAGAVGASIYQMYEPVAAKDYHLEEIILDSSRRYFNKMGFVFLFLVVICGPVFAYTKQNGKLSFWELLFAFTILGINAAIYFFYLSWYDILFSSNQKRYILSIGSIFERIVYYILLFLILFYKLNFLLMYVIVLLSSLCKIIYYYFYYLKKYKKNIARKLKKNNFRIPNKGYLLCNQIALQVVESIPTLIIAYMYDLAYAAVYSVYYLVQNMIKMILRTIQNSVSEIFGNLVVTEEEGKIRSVYEFIEYIFFALGTFFGINLTILYLPFIFVYTGGNGLDQNYIYPLLSFLIVVNNLIFCAFTPINMLINIKGYFKETYIQTIICALLGIIVSIVLVKISWNLVVIGPIIFYTISYFYRCIIIKKSINWYKMHITITRTIIMSNMVFISWIISKKIFEYNLFTSWICWIVFSALSMFGSVLCIMVYTVFYEKESLKMIKLYTKILFGRR